MVWHGFHGRYWLTPGLAAVALVAFGGCTTAPPRLPVELPPTVVDAPRPPQPIADGRWELIGSSFITSGQLPGERRPTLEFKAGRLAAFSGCNRASGNAIEADGRMAVGALATTRMACPEPLASFEQRFFKLIESEPALRIEGGLLILVAGKDSARFKRTDDASGARP